MFRLMEAILDHVANTYWGQLGVMLGHLGAMLWPSGGRLMPNRFTIGQGGGGPQWSPAGVGGYIYIFNLFIYLFII